MRGGKGEILISYETSFNSCSYQPQRLQLPLNIFETSKEANKIEINEMQFNFFLKFIIFNSESHKKSFKKTNFDSRIFFFLIKIAQLNNFSRWNETNCGTNCVQAEQQQQPVHEP